MPREERWHQQPVALLGGIAIFVSFAAALLLRVELSREVVVILLGGEMVFTLGLLDDLFGTLPVVYLQQWELDPTHPRLSLPLRVRFYHNLGSTEGKLRALLQDFDFGL